MGSEGAIIGPNVRFESEYFRYSLQFCSGAATRLYIRKIKMKRKIDKIQLFQFLLCTMSGFIENINDMSDRIQYQSICMYLLNNFNIQTPSKFYIKFIFVTERVFIKDFLSQF